VRTCVSCGAKRSKKEMLRFVLDQDKQLVRDDAGHRAGRGAYACNVSSCIETLMNRRRFERAFKVPREQRPEVGEHQREAP
jgi:predicted RNA-binding protein YlxR (DUF448 family)